MLLPVRDLIAGVPTIPKPLPCRQSVLQFSVCLIAALLACPERAERTVLAIGEVLPFLVGQPMFPSLMTIDLTPCFSKKSLISRWTLGLVVTSFATQR